MAAVGRGDNSPAEGREWHHRRPFSARPIAGETSPTMSNGPEDSFDVQRVLMDRARRQAERDCEPVVRPLLPRLLGLGLALLVVLVVLFAFDRFLASMQRFLALPIEDPEPSVTEPLPAYVVPVEPAPPADDQAPDVVSGAPAADDAGAASTDTGT
jgi:hypothetical protein